LSLHLLAPRVACTSSNSHFEVESMAKWPLDDVNFPELFATCGIWCVHKWTP
jgi:hypothetical protein